MVSILKNKILIWDNDGTISGSQNPNDTTVGSKVILPKVQDTMDTAKFNFVISGCKTVESENQNFNPELVVDKFMKLMTQLPISAAAFSPSIGGIECFVVMKKASRFYIRKAHEDPRYIEFVGKFKKPEIGMFHVIRDIALEEFGVYINSESSVMIGDTWHDQTAAESFGISFLDAKQIHNGLTI